MPIYEYGCSGCGHVFEQVQKISDPTPSECPECGGSEIEKMMSSGAFHLKGGGWYSDGYSKEKKPASCDSPQKSSACGTCPAA